MMYGRHFASMYEGSMVGAGAHVFAVMGYIIAKQTADRVVGTQVELNPKLLAFVLGESEERIQEAIEFLCAPDAKSRTDANGGRRLVRLGQFAYKVVNGAKYRAIRDEEARRESNRTAQQRHRAKKISSTAAEQTAETLRKNGDDVGADRVINIAENARELERREKQLAAANSEPALDQ